MDNESHTTQDKRDPESGVLLAEVDEATEEGQGASVAGIWKCPKCQAQIQIIIGPSQEATQPFTCVCGTPMVAGEEH